MKSSNLALLTSAAMALSIPNYQSGTGWSIKREEELHIKRAINPSPATVIDEGIKSSTISENVTVVDPKHSEVIFFPRDSPEAKELEEPNLRQSSKDYDDMDLIFIPREFIDSQESEQPKVPQESDDSKEYDDADLIFIPRHFFDAPESKESNVPQELTESDDDDDSDLIFVPRDLPDAQNYKEPNVPQVAYYSEESEESKVPQESEDYDDSDLIFIPRDFQDSNELKERLVASETELISIAQKVYDTDKLDVSRYFAIEAEIIQFRKDLRSSYEENKEDMEGLFNKVVIAFRKLNTRIGDVCYGRYDPHGYCSIFSADVFLTYVRGIRMTFRFLLGEFRDDRYIKDPEHSVNYVPNLVYDYKIAANSLMELEKRGTTHWLNGNRGEAMTEFKALKLDFQRLTTIMQQYSLV